MQTQAVEEQATAHFQRAEALFDAGKQDSAMMVLRYIVRTAGIDETEAYFSALLLMAEIHRRWGVISTVLFNCYREHMLN